MAPYAAEQLKAKRGARMKKKRHERRMLALGRRLLRLAGAPTSGGHSTAVPCGTDELGVTVWSSTRFTVIQMAQDEVDRNARVSRCGRCGERNPDVPCGEPCDLVPW